MKFFVVVFALCVAGALSHLTDEQKEKLKVHKEKCITETGVDPMAIENAKQGNVDHADGKLACFAACMLKEIGIMNTDGTMNEEVARAKMPTSVPKEKVDELMTKCKNLKGATDCETGSMIMDCYMKEKPFDFLHH